MVVSEAEAPLPYHRVRRLQFGLDLAAGAPTSAEVEDVGRASRITLRNRLPPEEHRVLIALSRSVEGYGRPPLRCVVAKDVMPDVRALLTGLGVRVIDSEGQGA